MIPKTLLLVKQICPGTPQIDNLGTAIPILFETGTLKTVKSITDPFAAAHDTLVLVVAEGTFIADSDQSGGADVGVADGTFAVAFVADAADRDARLFPTHY